MQSYPSSIGIPSKVSLANVDNIVVGVNHSYAITSQGLYAWGNNENLNLGVETGDSAVFEPMFLNLKVKKIATCTRHTLAWNEKQVYGWGSNLKFELGLPDQKYYSATKITLFEEASENNIPYVDFACGESHSLAIMKKSYDASKPSPSKKVLFGWGNCENGQLPFDSNKIIPYPVYYDFQKEIDQIYSESDYSLMISEHNVYTWGKDTFGRLGTAKGVEKVMRGKKIPRMLSLEKIVTIGIGSIHVVAVNSLGKAFSWGCGHNGQLGIGQFTKISSSIPQQMIIKEFVVAASCGKSHTLLLTDKQEIFSCGSNLDKCLGIDKSLLKDKKKISSPMKIDIYGIVKICSGQNHNLVLSKSGKIYSWGNNKYGQLGLQLMSEVQSEQEVQSSVSMISPKPKYNRLQEWHKKYTQFKKARDEQEKALMEQFQEIMSSLKYEV